MSLLWFLLLLYVQRYNIWLWVGCKKNKFESFESFSGVKPVSVTNITIVMMIIIITIDIINTHHFYCVCRDTIFDYWLDIRTNKFESWKSSSGFKPIEYNPNSMDMSSVTGICQLFHIFFYIQKFPNDSHSIRIYKYLIYLYISNAIGNCIRIFIYIYFQIFFILFVLSSFESNVYF